jgi:hypothetical protein
MLKINCAGTESSQREPLKQQMKWCFVWFFACLRSKSFYNKLVQGDLLKFPYKLYVHRTHTDM